MGVSGSFLNLHFEIPGDDLTIAGEASSTVKRKLTQLGIDPAIIKKTAISMYEAEINVVIHAHGGTADVEIDEDKIVIVFKDNGPGIPDIGLAMTAGYSTASDEIREMGFGAGMGLPNIKRYADDMHIDSVVGKGTTLKLTVFFKPL